VIRLSPRAARDLDALLAYYDAHDRAEAVRNLQAAVARAATRIERDPGAGLPAPRPYPSLARPGRRWIREGVYWISYATTDPPVISGVFHERADIPGRI